MNKVIIFIMCFTVSLAIIAGVQNNKQEEKEKAELVAMETELCEYAETIENNLHILNTMMYNIDVIHQLSEEYEVPMEVILAVMRVESRFDPFATSPDGRNYGLMQINQVHLSELANKMEILEIPKNVESGVSLLSSLMEQEEDLHYVLNSYNMGVTGYQNYVNQTGERTRAYSRTVLRFAEELERSPL